MEALEKWEEILKGFRNLRRLLQREAEKYGYSSTEIQILYQLHIKPRNITELSELIGIGKSSVTEIIEKMEKRNLVKKIKNENDKRYTIIKITEEGEKALEQTREEYKKILSSILERVNAEEVIKFFEEIEKELNR
ncbi:MarR family winged helix-turn-helix transcriptional regulator [Acidianus brierleyi]|uniref:MarR family winged helix-turn-helix transcriptional regulator n=1 Tax=Acidianus brierleyi TaxID=41673 RepID=UPI0013A5BB8B|nr:MarR family transcriptional regulator [Acidianus brierleyi]